MDDKSHIKNLIANNTTGLFTNTNEGQIVYSSGAPNEEANKQFKGIQRNQLTEAHEHFM